MASKFALERHDCQNERLRGRDQAGGDIPRLPYPPYVCGKCHSFIDVELMHESLHLRSRDLRESFQARVGSDPAKHESRSAVRQSRWYGFSDEGMDLTH